MFISGFNRLSPLLMLVFVLAGCSKHAEIENLLEQYYRAAARGDGEKLVELADTRAYSLTNSNDRGLLRSKFQQVVAEMNLLSNLNGELKKIDITQVEDFKNNDETLQKVSFNLVFKNDRTVTVKELISRLDGKAKVYIRNEWASTETTRRLFGY